MLWISKPLESEMAYRSAADEFISGKPAVYTGFDGNLYVATYFNGEKNKSGVGHLQIANARGKVVASPLMAEHQARSFLWNLDAQAEA